MGSIPVASTIPLTAHRMGESVPLICLTRSGVPDTLHRGSAVALDDQGRVLLAVGDPDTRAYIRSAAKPVQCIPVITSGAADAFRLDGHDLAIISGSHRGGDAQVAQVRSILARCGLPESLLQSGTGMADNCSGKHAGMLAACKHLGLPLDTYTAPDHPHQRAILRVLNEVCGLVEGEAHIGIDGCSAPIHCFSIRKMALGFARMSVPERHFKEPAASAIRRITAAMWTAPDGHTGEPLYRNVLPGGTRLITKGGGNGVYCAGVLGRGIGFALKVDDGSTYPLYPVFTELMRRLGVFSDSDAARIRERVWRRIDNRRGQVVGTIELLL